MKGPPSSAQGSWRSAPTGSWTLQEDAHFGRILAAYGGIFVAGLLAWGMVADGFRPDRFDYLGAGDGFAFVDYDGHSVFDLDAAPDFDPAANRAGCYLTARDTDAWHARLERDGLPVTPLADQPWGMCEFTLTDPFGNRVRIGRGVGDEDAAD